MKKNLLKYLIMTALLLCVIAADSRTLYASGGDKITSGDYTYRRLSDGTAELVHYNNTKAKVIEIPSKIDGLEVTVIGKKAIDSQVAKEIHIAEGVREIKEKAFFTCGSVKLMDLPDSVESIHCNACWFTDGIEKIILPRKLKSFKLRFFESFFDLKKIEMRGNGKGVKYSVEDGILYNRDKTTALYCPRARKKSVVLNKNVKRIRKNFVEWRYVSQIKVPATVEKLDEKALARIQCNITFYGKSKKIPVISKRAFYETRGKYYGEAIKMYVPANQYEAYKKILKDKNIAAKSNIKLMKLAE